MCSEAKKKKLEECVNEDGPMEVEEYFDWVIMLNNPVSMLNEYAQKKKILFPIYNLVSEMGQQHCRMFRMNCVFMNFKTEGSDKTKQDAKKKAAEEMVFLLASKNYLPCPRGVQQVSIAVHQTPQNIVTTLNNNTVTDNSDVDSIANPIGWLQEYCLKNAWKMPEYEEVGVIDGKFHCRCKCNTFVVTGSGFRKQVAKTNAALHMCYLVNGNTSTDDLPNRINVPKRETALMTPPRSELKAPNSEIDYVDSDSVDSCFVEENGEEDDLESKYSIRLLHDVLSMSKVSKPEFEHVDSEEKSGRVFTCLCRVIALETYGFGRSKVEAKSEAADRMVRKIFTYAKTGDTDYSCEEQQAKIKEYLQELQLKEFGGHENKCKKDEIIKKWLELRKQFPSAKAKPKKAMDCRERHCFFKNLEGCYINRLRNSSDDEFNNLVAQGMNFLQHLATEQNFNFRPITISSYGQEQLCILTIDAEVPMAFYGMHKNLHEAKENSIKNCIETLKLLLQ